MNQSQASSLSRRLGPVFAEVARKQSMEEHKAEYRARPLADRLNGAATTEVAEGSSPAKAYKPAHGGYPG